MAFALGGVFGTLGRRISGLGNNGLLWLYDRHVAFGDSRLIAFGLALRSGSARWDSPWLARAEEIPQEKRTLSLTNPVVEDPGGWAAGICRTAPADDGRLLLRWGFS